MHKYRVFTAIVILVLASLACQALSGGGGSGGGGDDTSPPVSDDNSPSASPSDSEPGDVGGGGGSFDTEFPLTDDAYNITDIGDGSLLYYTKMSLDDVMKFYRDEYTSNGYTEREILTVVNGGVFSMVFDGDPSGKAVVIQSVDLGDGSRTVAIRLEDV